MVESVLKAFDQELIQSGVADSFRIGINHGDYNDANILMNSSFEVTGVIDFGDSVERWVPIVRACRLWNKLIKLECPAARTSRLI